jgi:hypothetical protein
MGLAITHTSKRMVFNALNRDGYPCEPSHSHHIFCFSIQYMPEIYILLHESQAVSQSHFQVKLTVPSSGTGSS